MSTEEYLEGFQKEIEQKGSSNIFLKIVPGASKTELKEVLETVPPRLKIRVKSVPEKGKANQEVQSFLETIFPNTKAEVVQGFTSPLKKVRIEKKD